MAQERFLLTQATDPLAAPTGSAKPAENTASRKAAAKAAVEARKGELRIGRNSVTMEISVIPFVFVLVIAGLWFLAPESRRPDVRKRLRRDKESYMILALIPVGAVILAYLLSPRRIPVYLAWLTLPIVIGLAVKWLFGPDREEPNEGIDLPEDLRRQLGE